MYGRAGLSMGRQNAHLPNPHRLPRLTRMPHAGRGTPIRAWVVEWIGRPLISPTPSPGHRQVTFGRRYEKYVGQSTLDKVGRADFTLPLRHPDEEHGLDK